MQNNDRREQHDIIGKCNSADSGLFALCPGLSRKIIENKVLLSAGMVAWLVARRNKKISNRNKENDRRI